MAQNPLWMNVSNTIGTAAIQGPMYGIISRSPVITDKVSMLGIFIQHKLRIHKEIPKIAARIQERSILAFNQAESWV